MPSDRQPAPPVDFSRRAYLKEWMDEPCAYEDFRDCLRDLARLNRLSFAHRPTLRFVAGLAARSAGPLHIVDVGCGGGDLLRRIEAWAWQRKVPVRLTGVDLNEYAARAAREFTPAGSSIRWLTGNAFSLGPELKVDVVVSSLLTHHLADAEIVQFLRWMERTAARGWFINDLLRSRFPYHGVMALTGALRWHRFVRHDGPVSVRRSFSVQDWRGYLGEAGMEQAAVEFTGVGPARLCLARVKG